MSRFFPLAISILMGAGCSRHETGAAAPHTEPTTAEVEVETVHVSTIAGIYRASGTVRARQIAAIAPKIVASILEVGVSTVETHRANLMQKLGLHNTAEIVLYAVRKSLVT